MTPDFGAIRTEYVPSTKSLSELAQEHGLSKTALFNHSSAEEWVEARKEYQRKRAEHIEQKLPKADAQKKTTDSRGLQTQRLRTRELAVMK